MKYDRVDTKINNGKLMIVKFPADDMEDEKHG